MTGEDHNSDALIAALRSPALPAEQVGEAAAVSAMVEAQTLIPVASQGARSRRGIAIAAVTVASLGLGGLAAAGPGIFTPAADQPETTTPPPSTLAESLAEESGEQGEGTDEEGEPQPQTAGVERISDDPEVECAEGNHGKTVSSIARSTDTDGIAVASAAQSDCGKPDRGAEPDDDEATADDADVECADGNHGKTVSSVAQATTPDGNHGEAVSEAARSDCGKPGDGDSPGKSGEAPGQTGENPGKSGEAPGQTGETPGQSGEAPGQTGEAPGKSDDKPESPGKPKP